MKSFTAWILVVLAFEVYLFGVHAPRRVVGRGPHRTEIAEFGRGAPIVQSFAVRGTGLEEVRVRATSTGPARGTLAWTLSAGGSPSWTPVITKRQPLDLGGGSHWVPLRFPPMEASDGRTFQITMRFEPAAGPPPHDLSLAASLDDAVPGGFLTVDGAERWGDLWFEARTAEDVAAARFLLRAAAGLPAPLNADWAWAAMLAALNVVLVVFLWTQLQHTVAPPMANTVATPRRRGLAFSAVLITLMGAVGGVVALGRRSTADVDLIDDLYRAKMEYSNALHWNFHVRDTGLAGQDMHAIYAHAPSTIRWPVTIPVHGHLRLALGIEAGAWGFPEGDGVVFRIRVNDSGRETERLMRHVDPVHVEGDQRWIPVDLNLHEFAGRVIELSFVTEPSAPGAPVNGAYDWALWGSPRIVVVN